MKRSQHIKHKKNFGRQQKKSLKALPDNQSKSSGSKKNIFGKPAKPKPSGPREKGHSQRERPAPAAAVSEKPANGDEDAGDELDEDEMRDMLDEDDALKYKTKRKRTNDADGDATVALEKDYDEDRAQVNSSKKKRTVDLLPIKTKMGEIITRSTEVDIREVEHEEDEEEGDEEAEEEEVDSDDEIINDATVGGRFEALETELISMILQSNFSGLTNAAGKSVSTTDLLILREQELNRQKYRVGIICSSILEKPDDKMKNFKLLFELMSNRNKNEEPNLFSVRKMATMSVLEVFKDIIPEYRIGQIDLKRQQGESHEIEMRKTV